MIYFTMIQNVFICIILQTVSGQDAVIWITESGSVRGEENYLLDDPRPIYAFKGIPYAYPPTGTMRFQPPRMLPIWNGERSALTYGDRCYQDRDYTNMSEDCLYLNIHTPTLDSSSRLAVMVNIHGGGLTTGSGNRNAIALTHMNDVVFVSMNYRLGPLGFFTTGDNSAPGNIGLLDQQMAIQWVKQYIQRFGGDPDRITIMGDSGGAVSVSTHILSPTNAGLFQRAISNSGVATAAGRVNTREEEVEKSLTVAAVLGCVELDNSALVECMQALDPATITSHGSGLTLYPYVDGRFLTQLAFNAYNTGNFNHIEYLLGFNRDEGIYFFGSSQPDESNIRELITTYTERFYPENTEAIVDAIMPVYVDFDTFDRVEDYERAYSNFIGDLRYIGPTNDVARKHSVYNSTYLFFFNHRPAYSSYPEWVSATHSDQRPFVMGFPFSDPLRGYGPEGFDLSEDMMKYYTNFAKTGNPNGEGLPNWPRVSCSNKEYLQLVYGPRAGQNYEPERIRLWTDTIPGLDTYRSPSYVGFPWNCPSQYLFTEI